MANKPINKEYLINSLKSFEQDVLNNKYQKKGTASGSAIESISVNGTPIEIDENKNVDIPVPNVDDIDLSNYQVKTDDSLNTTDKTIPGAINELKLYTDSKSNKSVILNFTLASSSWSNYEYTLDIENIGDYNGVEITCPYDTINDEQLETIIDANIVPKSSTSSSLTLKAYGDVPTIDIPIIVILRGDL